MEILSILHGDFGPADLIARIDGVKRRIVNRNVFGFNIPVIEQDDSATMRDVIDAALNVQKEYSHA